MEPHFEILMLFKKKIKNKGSKAQKFGNGLCFLGRVSCFSSLYMCNWAGRLLKEINGLDSDMH